MVVCDFYLTVGLEHTNLAKGNKTRLTKDRFIKLDDLGFKWSTPISRDETIDIMEGRKRGTFPYTTEHAENTQAPTEEKPLDVSRGQAQAAEV